MAAPRHTHAHALLRLRSRLCAVLSVSPLAIFSTCRPRTARPASQCTPNVCNDVTVRETRPAKSQITPPPQGSRARPAAPSQDAVGHCHARSRASACAPLSLSLAVASSLSGVPERPLVPRACLREGFRSPRQVASARAGKAPREETPPPSRPRREGGAACPGRSCRPSERKKMVQLPPHPSIPRPHQRRRRPQQQASAVAAAGRTRHS